MSEQVLVIPKEKFNINFSLVLLKNTINTYGKFIDRTIAEKDESFLQIIPYIVLKNHEQIFCYERLKKGGEARLHSMYSIGIGGHVNLIDYDPSYSNWVAVESAAYRELMDELNIEDDLDKEVVIDFTNTLIYDDTNPVGRVHLGIVCHCNVDGRTITVREVDKIKGSFTTKEKIISMGHAGHLENWSNIAIESGLL